MSISGQPPGLIHKRLKIVVREPGGMSRRISVSRPHFGAMRLRLEPGSILHVSPLVGVLAQHECRPRLITTLARKSEIQGPVPLCLVSVQASVLVTRMRWAIRPGHGCNIPYSTDSMTSREGLPLYLDIFGPCCHLPRRCAARAAFHPD